MPKEFGPRFGFSDMVVGLILAKPISWNMLVKRSGRVRLCMALDILAERALGREIILKTVQKYLIGIYIRSSGVLKM